MLMESVEMAVDGTTQASSSQLSFARSYQLEALEKALTDVEIATMPKLEPLLYQQTIFVAPELVGERSKDYEKIYYCYLIELSRNFDYDVPVQDIILAVRNKLDVDDECLTVELEVDRGIMGVHIKYIGGVPLDSEQVVLCQRFQVSVLRVLLDNDRNKLKEVQDAFNLRNETLAFDYLLLPFKSSPQKKFSIDWECISSVMWDDLTKCSSRNCKGRNVQTKNCLTCLCMLENSLVYTPHNDRLYCTKGILYDMNANSRLKYKDGKPVTYKQYFKEKQGIDLRFVGEPLINGRQVFPVQNHLHTCKRQKHREPGKSSVELPAELCYILLSPISVSTFYTFSFVPSILHHIEALLIASNLRKICLNHCTQNVMIPASKVLEAITTKRCQEKYHLESLETLGDSFLKYVVSQQLFKNHPSHHEGLLTEKRKKIICNAALCKLGCDKKLTGFIRTESFDPKMMIIPGDHSRDYELIEESFSQRCKVYIRGRRNIEGMVVADVIEALIGAFLSSGGETVAIQFMDFVGIKMEFNNISYERNLTIQPEKLVDISFFESLMNYTFQDSSFLVEALTHGSCMRPEIPRCYQRLEFLGDAVLDYMITMHLYERYPGLSPGQLTDLRSASVNNDCYAQSAAKAGLHKHILHNSQELYRHLSNSLENFDESSEDPTYGWDCEIKFPKVLADLIESIAGAILVDSGYDKDVVFASIRPLLEPLITPETLKLHPVRELNEICQRNNFKTVFSYENGGATLTIEVEANGIVICKRTCTAANKKMAERVASKAVLKDLEGKAFPNENGYKIMLC